MGKVFFIVFFENNLLVLFIHSLLMIMTSLINFSVFLRSYGGSPLKIRGSEERSIYDTKYTTIKCNPALIYGVYKELMQKLSPLKIPSYSLLLLVMMSIFSTSLAYSSTFKSIQITDVLSSKKIHLITAINSWKVLKSEINSKRRLKETFTAFNQRNIEAKEKLRKLTGRKFVLEFYLTNEKTQFNWQNEIFQLDINLPVAAMLNKGANDANKKVPVMFRVSEDLGFEMESFKTDIFINIFFNFTEQDYIVIEKTEVFYNNKKVN